MIKPGYTIIELVVALAISALLLSLTVSRYDSFEQHTALRVQAQSLAACMQAANAAIQTPPASASGTPAVSQAAVTVSTDANGTGVYCSYALDDSTGTPLDGSGQQSSVDQGGIYFCYGAYGSGGLNNIGSLPVGYVLRTATHGVIDSLTVGNTVEPTQAQPGQGLPVSLQFSKQVPTTSDPCDSPVTVSIPVSGSPIEVSS